MSDAAIVYILLYHFMTSDGSKRMHFSCVSPSMQFKMHLQSSQAAAFITHSSFAYKKKKKKSQPLIFKRESYSENHHPQANQIGVHFTNVMF